GHPADGRARLQLPGLRLLMWKLGGQTVGIVTRVPTLDIDNKPVVSEFMEPQDAAPAVVWVYNCLFETQESARPKTAEDQRGGTVVTNMTAWVFMPVTPDGLIPAYDAESEGNPVTPVNPATITSSAFLRYGLDY